MTIDRFEDLEAWQRAREFVRLVYRHTVNPRFTRDYGLQDQMRRAAVSTWPISPKDFPGGLTRNFANSYLSPRVPRPNFRATPMWPWIRHTLNPDSAVEKFHGD